ncbi:HU family DNA-binding protein [bacterium]|nr:HU family DNA-binding protein [bacterium]
MNKADLVEKMAGEAGISKVAAEKALNAFIAGVKGALKKGDNVTLIGFGTYSVASRKARIGRNPQTGAELKIPSRKVVKFKSGKGLKDVVG